MEPRSPNIIASIRAKEKYKQYVEPEMNKPMPLGIVSYIRSVRKPANAVASTINT